MSGEIYRYDRKGRKSLVSSDQTKAALAVLQIATNQRQAQERADLKARQNAGLLTAEERMLTSIFGEIK